MTKSNILYIILLLFLLSAIITGSRFSPKTGTKAVAGVKAKSTELPNHNQVQSPLDSIMEYLEYKGEVIKKIRQNERRIANLKDKIKIADMEIEDDYIKPLDILEQRNKALSSRIQEYKEGAPQNWEIFKHHINKDINEIDKTISLMAEISLSKN